MVLDTVTNLPTSWSKAIIREANICSANQKMAMWLTEHKYLVLFDNCVFLGYYTV